mgnify:FL=1
MTTGPEVLETAQEYLRPLQDSGVDTLVLGCTHYPLLTGVISYVMGEAVTLVSSAEETAKDVYRALVRHDLARVQPPQEPHEFLATGDPEPFQILARRFLGPEVTAVRHVGSVAEQFPTGSLSQVSSQMLAEHAAVKDRASAGPSPVRACLLYTSPSPRD